MTDKTIIIAGLGNPGKKYELTRHNVGFLVLESLAEHYGIALDQSRWESEYGRGRLKNEREDALDIVLLKPLTYMNLSGKAVCPAARFFKIPPEQLLVIHDEIELPPGETRAKKGGGHKGHNGLRDIIEKCGSADFHRLRVGVGRPDHQDVAGYLLSPFTHEEQERLPEIVEHAREYCVEWVHRIK